MHVVLHYTEKLHLLGCGFKVINLLFSSYVLSNWTSHLQGTFTPRQQVHFQSDEMIDRNIDSQSKSI